ncbi:hypothetical protein BC940DRAFT_359496 [Gongronella butleri]|nr:hypothetical protein BC940DRAFT_359496 [Gongronella butleri]
MSDLDLDTWKTCSTFKVDIPGRLKALRQEELHASYGSFDRRQNLENVFCHDFICCDQYWNSLHDLLEHEESCHANTQPDDDMFNDSAGSSDHEDQEDCIVNIDDDDDDMDLDDDDDDVLRTPDTPAGLVRIPSPFIPKHITSADLNMLENIHVQRKPPVMRPPPQQFHAPVEAPEEYGYEKIKEWMEQAQQWIRDHDHEVSDDDTHRPYRCTVEGCSKAYKNANGLKYHRAHGHCHEKEQDDLDDMASRPYTCLLGTCKKRYKNLNGLKYHIQHTHCRRRPDTVGMSFPPPLEMLK